MGSMISVRPVNGSDYPFLYDLLKEKTPEQNISHKEMPTYEQHVAFNDAHPYAHDWIIQVDPDMFIPGVTRVAPYKAGRIYLTKQDEVGIHIKREYAGQGIGGQALELLITMTNRPLLANIAPSNLPSQGFFVKHGFHLVQYTYRRD